MLRIAADMGVGVAGGGEDADGSGGVVQCGLNREFFTGGELIFPGGAYFKNFPAKLVTDHNRFVGDGVGNALMFGALCGGFVGGHTDRIGNNLGQNFIGLDGGQIKVVEA